MKKLLFIALLCTQLTHAQEVRDSLRTEILNRKNELRVDVLSLILSSKINLSYERFLDKDFSVGVAFGYIRHDEANDDFDRGYRNYLPVYEINPYVRYNLSKSLIHFYFAEVFLSANGGDFKEIVRLNDEAGNAYYTTEKSTYTDFGIGAGVGYKIYIKEKVPLEIMVGFGTNLFNKEKSPDVLNRVGISVGYRF